MATPDSLLVGLVRSTLPSLMLLFFCFSLVAAVAEDSASNGVVTAGNGAEDGGSRCFDASSFVPSSTPGHSKQADARSRRGDGRRNEGGDGSHDMWIVDAGEMVNGWYLAEI
uniref:Uncharacterized protein n=1 Tax=Oryza sativa subsp. japonica TaxID=39947 RepID=Q6Z2D2_ORYSJ|nr:hypothetical protein [Oryza sativa Japonica Group]BAD01357.1 hypothetical protein [Oryza sativa Japonica Group]